MQFIKDPYHPLSLYETHRTSIVTMQQKSLEPREIRKLQRFIRLLSLFRVPLLGLLRPRIVELTNRRAEVQLPYEFLTKNHVGSMYFGALAMGAELSIALRLLDRMHREKAPIQFIFKDFSADFLKRAESAVSFVTEEVGEIDQLIETCLQSSKRENGSFRGFAQNSGGEKLMNYQLTISIKKTEIRK
jgi:hypothetical protein